MSKIVRIEFQRGVPLAYAEKVLKIIKEAHEKTQKTIDSDVAQRDFAVHQAIEANYDAEDYFISNLEKGIEKAKEKSDE